MQQDFKDIFKKKQSTYECCYVDFDTVLYRAASMVQQNYIMVTHKATGKSKRFDGVTKFYGKGKAQDGGWIGEQNQRRSEAGKPLIKAEDFVIEEMAELREVPPEYKDVMDWALSTIDYKVGDIKKTSQAETYVLGIGGSSNFRYDAAHILPYKGKRKPKPLMFEELREAFINKYKSKVMIARDGLEQDDEVSIKGWESHRHFLKTGKHKYVLAYIDKDINSVPCPYFNYDKCEEGIITPTIEDCARAFCSQLLSGDLSTDNIQGLPNLGVEFAAKYGLPKPRGVGKATALKVLEDCKTPKEMYERVIEAYKAYYGTESFAFKSFRGEESNRTWLDMLRENALLLHMMRKHDERFDIEQTFKRMEIDY